MQRARLALSAQSLHPSVLAFFAQVPAAARRGMVIADVPAGDGILTFPLLAAGFDVRPLDLFPEYLAQRAATLEGLTASTLYQRMAGGGLPDWLAGRLWGPGRDAPLPASPPACLPADMEDVLPLPDASADVVLCVEGIEHVVDRHRTLRQFRRVLRPGGTLLLTTPNLMSARARLAYAFAGQRAFKSYVDEHTSVWGQSPDAQRVYHGHAFLLTYFQLRYSLYHCGFRIRRLRCSNVSPSSLLAWPLLAPGVALATWASQRRAKKKFARLAANTDPLAYRPPAGTAPPYGEMFRHLLSPALMLGATMVVEAEARA